MALQTSMTVIDKMLQDKMDDLENHVDTLLKQKGIIESIETYSDRLDFGDLLETYKLLVEEIDRTQQELQRMKNVYSLPLSGENECVEEEEEEVSSFSFNKFDIDKQEKNLELIRKRDREVKMTQEEITGFLDKNKARWYTSSQIAQAIGVSRPSVNKSLGRMKKHSEVQEKRIRVMLKGKLGLIPKEVPFYSYK